MGSRLNVCKMCPRLNAVISGFGELRAKSQKPQAAPPSLGGQAGWVTSPHPSPQESRIMCKNKMKQMCHYDSDRNVNQLKTSEQNALTACLVAAGMAVVTADRGKSIETCAYLSIVPAVSGLLAANREPVR
ncbi:uncharacterized protein LOC113946434 isoform X4 [Corapipo altera]|uniref:uncharacterized protein LOC113946434 isoform X4 n=1 Tax=Corapipo altera TaxID=415028 RepID=UPI000FD6A985|nr:uncharacterized protein LOC113946434 isoform X4 [Corapipo altera]